MTQFSLTGFEDITPKEAIQMQKELRGQILLRPFEGDPKTVGGADISFNRGSNIVHAGIVVLSLATLEPVAYSLVTTEVTFPYVPGLLAFREIPALAEAWHQCRQKPDLLIMDGHGIAHPRRMGIATHFGILAGHPTVGCAKNVLTGTYKEPDSKRGSYSWLTDKNERIGMVLRSRTRVNPIFVSPGYKMDFRTSRQIVEKTLTKYKLPETTRAAHRLVNELRTGRLEEGYVSNPVFE